MDGDRAEGGVETGDDYTGEEVPEDARPGEETFDEAQDEADELNEQAREDAEQGG